MKSKRAPAKTDAKPGASHSRPPRRAAAVIQPAVIRKKILLVDDHPMMRIGVTTLINAEPDLTVCFQASKAEEALIEIPQCSPDLVITDMTMPGRGGLELIKDIKALHPSLPVLVISMHDEMLHAERALRAGARGYLMKEAGGEKMLEAIRKVLSGQVYVSDKMAGKIFDIFSGRRAQSHQQSPIEKLTDREFQVFQLIGQGKTTKDVAKQLNLSSKTVDVHRGHIKEKLELKDATSLVRYAVRWVETQAGGSGTP
jgi:DNA-binding NarL/FixJ family response regulator